MSVQYLIERAEQEAAKTYGDRVSVSAKNKSLTKFGRNAVLGTSLATVWSYSGNETYATTNAISHVSSSSTSDTATVMTVEGHTVSGTGTDSQFTFVTQTVTLNGQTAVALTTPVARVSRAYVSSGTLVGDFYVHENDTLTAGVPQTASKVHITVLGATSGQTQSYKAATTFSNTDYAFLTGAYFSLDKKTSASADFTIEVAQPGGVFRPITGRVSLSTNGTNTVLIQFAPYLVVPKNSDIRVRAIASTTAVDVDATLQFFLASVIS